MCKANLVNQHPVPVPRGEILAHRGMWTEEVAPNSERAIAEALSRGFGLETDIRDHQGELVISHDPPLGEELRLTSLIHSPRARPSLLALNVKADGLASEISRLVPYDRNTEHFVFDMSFPQARVLAQTGIPMAARISEFESVEQSRAGPYASARYVWIDCFESDWFLTQNEISTALLERTSVLVSPEIHGRDPEAAWNWVCDMRLMGHRVGLCTDLPLEFLAWQMTNLGT
jgi:hypothetical protein